MLLDGEDLPPSPRQQRSADKRARLTAAGLALFGEKGYDATSIDEIAKRAGLAVGGFYQHFRSKRQLLLVLMDELLDHLSRLDLRPTGAVDVRAGLRALLSRAFSGDLHYLGAYRAWYEAALSDRDLAAKQDSIRAWTTSRVHTALGMLHLRLNARQGVDIAALAHVLDGFFWSVLAEAGRSPDMQLEAWIEAATHLMYHAMFTDGPQEPRGV